MRCITTSIVVCILAKWCCSLMDAKFHHMAPWYLVHIGSGHDIFWLRHKGVLQRKWEYCLQKSAICSGLNVLILYYRKLTIVQLMATTHCYHHLRVLCLYVVLSSAHSLPSSHLGVKWASGSLPKRLFAIEEYLPRLGNVLNPVIFSPRGSFLPKNHPWHSSIWKATLFPSI